MATGANGMLLLSQSRTEVLRSNYDTSNGTHSGDLISKTVNRQTKSFIEETDSKQIVLRNLDLIFSLSFDVSSAHLPVSSFV